MSVNLGKHRFTIKCPQCKFPAHIFFRQVKHRDVLVCGGCKANIQLVDHLGSYRKAERKVRRAIEGLTSSFGNLNITIRL